jgi:uncharacterized protein GlcG (DUF336 family)
VSRLTLAQADTIIDKALEKARAAKVPALAVMVLDDAGHI